MNNFERTRQLKKDLKSFKENPVTIGDDFEKTHQYEIDYNFVDQLRDIVDAINKEFPWAKLTMDMIEGYNGKDFLVNNKKMNIDKLKEHVKNLNEMNKKKFIDGIEANKENETEEKRLSNLYHNED